MNVKPLRRKVRKVVDRDTFVIDPPIHGFKYVHVLNLYCPKKNPLDYADARLLEEKIQGKTVIIAPKTSSHGLLVANVHCTPNHSHGTHQEETRSWNYTYILILSSLRTFIHECRRIIMEYIAADVFRNGGF